MKDHRSNWMIVNKIAWTGGDTPTKDFIKNSLRFRLVRSMFFREYVRECGGLDLWKCAGTSSLERARIFWNRATLDCWSSMRGML